MGREIRKYHNCSQVFLIPPDYHSLPKNPLSTQGTEFRGKALYEQLPRFSNLQAETVSEFTNTVLGGLTSNGFSGGATYTTASSVKL